MGILFAVTATVFMTAKDIFSKRISARLDGTLSAFASFVYALPFYFVALGAFWLLGIENFVISPSFWTYILARSITDTFAEWMKMSAMAYCELSIVSSLLSFSPVFLLLMSPAITGDKIPALGNLAVLIVVLGNLIVIRRNPVGPKTFSAKGIALGIGAAFFMSLNTCFDRLAVQSASPALSGFVMTALAGFFLYPLAYRRRAEFVKFRQESKALYSRGFLEIAFMVCKLYALKFLPGPYVIAIQRSSLLLSIVGGRTFLGEKDFARKFAAGLLIFFGVITILMLQ